MNVKKLAVLVWAETNRDIFAKLKELDRLNAEYQAIPWWNLWKEYNLKKQYDKCARGIIEKSNTNNTRLRLSLLCS